MADLKDVIYLSNEDYETLVTTGTVTIAGEVLVYNENNVYVTPEKLASTTEAGLMSPEDKTKLNGLDDSNLVHKTGDEEIPGNKVFTTSFKLDDDTNGDICCEYVTTSASGSEYTYPEIRIKNKDGSTVAEHLAITSGGIGISTRRTRSKSESILYSLGSISKTTTIQVTPITTTYTFPNKSGTFGLEEDCKNIYIVSELPAEYTEEDLTKLYKPYTNDINTEGAYSIDTIYTVDKEYIPGITCEALIDTWQKDTEIKTQTALYNYVNTNNFKTIFGENVAVALTKTYTAYFNFSETSKGDPAFHLEGFRLGTGSAAGTLSFSNLIVGRQVQFLVSRYFNVQQYDPGTGTERKITPDTNSVFVVNGQELTLPEDTSSQWFTVTVPNDGILTIGSKGTSSTRLFIYSFKYVSEEQNNYTATQLATINHINDLSDRITATDEKIGDVQIWEALELPEASPDYLNKIIRVDDKLYQCLEKGKLTTFNFTNVTGTGEITNNATYNQLADKDGIGVAWKADFHCEYFTFDSNADGSLEPNTFYYTEGWRNATTTLLSASKDIATIINNTGSNGDLAGWNTYSLNANYILSDLETIADQPLFTGHDQKNTFNFELYDRNNNWANLYFTVNETTSYDTTNFSIFYCSDVDSQEFKANKWYQNAGTIKLGNSSQCGYWDWHRYDNCKWPITRISMKVANNWYSGIGVNAVNRDGSNVYSQVRVNDPNAALTTLVFDGLNIAQYGNIRITSVNGKAGTDKAPKIHFAQYVDEEMQEHFDESIIEAIKSIDYMGPLAFTEYSAWSECFEHFGYIDGLPAMYINDFENGYEYFIDANTDYFKYVGQYVHLGVTYDRWQLFNRDGDGPIYATGIYILTDILVNPETNTFIDPIWSNRGESTFTDYRAVIKEISILFGEGPYVWEILNPTPEKSLEMVEVEELPEVGEEDVIYLMDSEDMPSPEADFHNMVSTTYATLKTARDTSQLTPGTWYRITDFVTTCHQNALGNQPCQSAGHAFDVIVLATSKNELNENAFATKHAGDTYFANNNLSAWKLKYCLDNNRELYSWAVPNTGKGVIHYMKDEFNNEAPYDFKNIQFRRYKLTAAPKTPELVGKYCVFMQYGSCGLYLHDDWEADENDYVWCYTFNDLENSLDDSLNIHCHNNSIKEINNCNGRSFDDLAFGNGNGYGILLLNNIVFGNNCSSNTFGNNCYNNTFGNGCYSNTFGNNCDSNTFGDFCDSNTFGNDCDSNTFGNYCYANTFGNYCHSNTFGNNCYFNTFRNNCYYNTFGNYCAGNTFGNYCAGNTFGDFCDSNTFGNYCGANTFGNYCYSNIFGNNCHYNTFAQNYYKNISIESGCSYLSIICTDTEASSANYLQNVHIHEGVCGSSSSNLKTITVPDRNLNYSINYYAVGSIDETV